MPSNPESRTACYGSGLKDYQLTPDDLEAFWVRVDRDADPEGCWLWHGLSDRGGYGRFWINGRDEGASRVAWTIENGPIPQGLQVRHGPSCVAEGIVGRGCMNPSHLRVGTARENMLDKGPGWFHREGPIEDIPVGDTMHKLMYAFMPAAIEAVGGEPSQ